MRTPGAVERYVNRMMPAFLRPLWNRLRGSGVAYRLLHGTFWSSLGAGSTQLVMLATSVVAARLLGRQQFGEYSVLMTTLGMFGVVTGFGIVATAARYIAEYRSKDPVQAGRIIGLTRVLSVTLGVVSTVVLFCGAPLLAARVLATPSMISVLQLGSLQVCISVMVSAQYGILTGLEAFRKIARLSLLSASLSLIFIIAGILYYGISGAVIGQVAALFIALIVGERAVYGETIRHSIPCSLHGCSAERRILFYFSLPAVLSGVMVTPVGWCAAAIIVNQPHGYAEMGLFNAANAWQKVIMFVPGCLGSVALPILSNLHASPASEDFNQAMRYQLRVNFVLAAVPASIIALLSWIILSCYGSDFSSGWPVLVILACAAIPNALAAALGTVLASAGKMWFGALLNLVWGGVLLGLVYVLRHKGAFGMAWAYAVAFSFQCLLGYWVVKRFAWQNQAGGGSLLHETGNGGSEA